MTEDRSPLPASILHPVQVDLPQLMADCDVRHGRRRGPGGQHRNKTDSAVVLTHRPTGVEGQASERRSQADNLRVATKRLRLNLALEIRTTALAEASPTDLWKSRCHQERFRCNPDHDDFAPLIAEALDVLADHHGHVPGAAAQLTVTASQLIKFLKNEPRAFLLLNTIRARYGLHPLE